MKSLMVMKSLIGLLILCASLSLNASIGCVIDKIKHRSAASQSDTLVILRNGSPMLVETSQENPYVDSMEMTKPFIGLAIALLLDEGRIPCLDLPIHTYYPEWDRQPYKGVTLRQLLGNTTGLDPDCSNRYCENTVSAILNTKLQYLPDDRYFKNSKGILLLIDIIRCASGKEFTDYLYQRLFEPLGIDNISWRGSGALDSLPQFQLSAWDLAKVGCLLAKGGEYQGKRIISHRWIDTLFSPSQTFDPFFGMQWWLEFYDINAWWDDDLLAIYTNAGVSPALICHLRNLQGRVIHFSGQVYGNYIVKLRGTELIAHFDEGRLMSQLIQETHCLGVPLARFKTGKLKMASAHGRGGQHLIIMPQQGLVAVRQKRCWPVGCCGYDNFDDLPDLLEEIAKECDCYID